MPDTVAIAPLSGKASEGWIGWRSRPARWVVQLPIRSCSSVLRHKIWRVEEFSVRSVCETQPRCSCFVKFSVVVSPGWNLERKHRFFITHWQKYRSSSRSSGGLTSIICICLFCGVFKNRNISVNMFCYFLHMTLFIIFFFLTKKYSVVLFCQIIDATGNSSFTLFWTLNRYLRVVE